MFEELDTATQILLAVGVFVAGVIVAGALAALIRKVLTKRTSEHYASIGWKLVFYGLIVVLALVSLRIANVELTTFLAAAGILGIAIGFAAQTSFANMISGIFLLFEQPFKVGDAIQVGTDTMGMVLSIDLLSVKLRKFDNQFIRVPNEQIIKSNITNLTRYDIRRFDVDISIAYSESIPEAIEVLEEVVKNHPMVLRKPDPQVLVSALADSGVNLMIRVWMDRTEFIQGLSDLRRDLKMALDDAGIEIPFPHRKHFASEDLLEALQSKENVNLPEQEGE